MPPSKQRRGLGVDPLEGLMGTETTGPTRTTEPTEPTQGASVGSVVRSSPKAPLKPVKLDGEVLDQVRAAVDWLRHHGDPYATLKGVLERAALAEVERLAAEHNAGQAFPRVDGLPRGGRRPAYFGGRTKL